MTKTDIITALTFNISWAYQQRTKAGSEEDFVRNCLEKKIICFENCLDIIANINNLHLVGLQEVNTIQIEEDIIKSHVSLNKYVRGTVLHSSASSTVSLIWDSKIFGESRENKVVNLCEGTGENRPCLFVRTSNGYQLICAHFPWIQDEKHLNKVYNSIRNNCFNTVLKTIILADTNDTQTLISKNDPFIFGSQQLSQGLTKKELEAGLISCCWHEQNHSLGWQSFNATGDYILADSSIMQHNYILDEHKEQLASDHRPVLALLKLPRANLCDQCRSNQEKDMCERSN